VPQVWVTTNPARLPRHLTSLEHERWKRAHPEFCRKMGIE